MKKALIMILALLPWLSSMAKGTESPDTISARRAFMEMPVGTLDLLTPEVRTNMLIYYDNDSIYKAKNTLGGLSFLEKVTPDFLEARLTDASSLQLKVLRMKDGSEVVMSIYTVGGPDDSRDSEISFYDSKMREIKGNKIFPLPKLSAFFDTKGHKTNMKEIEQILPFYTFLYEANPDNSDVAVSLTYEDRITIEDQKILEMFLRQPLEFKWDGSNFKIK